MKRLGGILLVTVYLFSFAELHNLLRVPVFFEHLGEHYDKDPDTTLWGFIREHYIGKIVVDDDFDRDQQLPFRDVQSGCIMQVSVECCVMAYDFPSPKIPLREFFSFTEQNRSLISTYDFFQPPRLA